jgi:hypothetical protein
MSVPAVLAVLNDYSCEDDLGMPNSVKRSVLLSKHVLDGDEYVEVVFFNMSSLY